jgi:hypothetical protein
MHEFLLLFFFLIQNFKQNAPLLGIAARTRNVVSLGRPKQNAQPGMFDGNHPIDG